MKTLTIGRRSIGEGHPCFVIAEIGSNHDQNLDQAKQMIREAARAGADAVKFQSIQYDEMYAAENPDVKKFYSQIELDEDWYPHLKKTADENSVYFFSAPCYLKAVALLEQAGVALYKIASPQTRSFPQLIRAAAKTGKVLIISTGYCDDQKIERAVQVCEAAGNSKYALLHCVSLYPANPEQMNLQYIATLRRKFHCPVGLSDHTLGSKIPIAAVARGCNIIEKHFTLNKKSAGPDHSFAFEPEEFRQMVVGIREVESAIGNGVKSVSIHEEEVFEKNELTYRIVAARDLSMGEPLREEILLFKRASSGIAAEKEDEWMGKRLARDIKKGEILEWSDLDDQ